MEKEETRNRQLLKEGDEGRAHLQVVIEESSRQTQQRASENKRYQDDLVSENKSLREKIDELENIIRQREDTIHERDTTINHKDREIQELNLKLSDLKQMKALNEQLSAAINRAENDRVELQRKYDAALEEHRRTLEREHRERNQLLDEMNELGKQLKARE